MKGASLTLVMDDTQSGALSFSGNSAREARGGTGGNIGAPAGNGSQIGNNIFLGGDTEFNVVQQSAVASISDLGGAGIQMIPMSTIMSLDPNAQGGLIKTGIGTLILQGIN